MKTILFRNGDRMPMLGLGTWKSEPGEVRDAVVDAVRLGYRHFDCAAAYGNEAEVGEALARCFDDGLVARDDVWVTSKLWNDRHDPDDVLPALEQTLADLRLEHVDLYLVHWPVALRKGVAFPDGPDDLLGLDQRPLAATWSGMERAFDAGLARHIGVSNFSLEKLGSVLEGARVRPEVDQVELHPYLQQRDLVETCQRQGVAVTAYAPLGSSDRPDAMKGADEPRLLDDPVIVGIAARRGATPAQVLIAWGLHRDTAVIPKSVSRDHLRENLAAADVALTAEDLAEIETLDRHHRYVDGSFWTMPGSPYSLASLWDE